MNAHRWILRARRHAKSLVEKRLKTYYSACGEDVILRCLFDSVGVTHPDYLDVGANDPVGGNNTYLFYRDGSRGVCVEPNRDLAARISLLRKGDTILPVAVAVDGSRSVDFHVFDRSGLSTTDPDEARRRERSGVFSVVEVRKVPALTINEVIAANFDSYPAILSLDVEGLDEPVLRSLDFARYPVPAICVETVAYTEGHVRTTNGAIEDLLAANGYFRYAHTYVNSIFVRDAWYRG